MIEEPITLEQSYWLVTTIEFCFEREPLAGTDIEKKQKHCFLSIWRNSQAITKPTPMDKIKKKTLVQYSSILLKEVSIKTAEMIAIKRIYKYQWLIYINSYSSL